MHIKKHKNRHCKIFILHFPVCVTRVSPALILFDVTSSVGPALYLLYAESVAVRDLSVLGERFVSIRNSEEYNMNLTWVLEFRVIGGYAPSPVLSLKLYG